MDCHRITFDFVPKFVIVSPANMGDLFGHWSSPVKSSVILAMRGTTGSTIVVSYTKEGSSSTTLTRANAVYKWLDEEFTFRWYTGANYNEDTQLNKTGTEYYYIGLG